MHEETDAVAAYVKNRVAGLTPLRLRWTQR